MDGPPKSRSKSWTNYCDPRHDGKDARAACNGATSLLSCIAGDEKSVEEIAMDIAGYKDQAKEIHLKAYIECGGSPPEGIM